MITAEQLLEVIRQQVVDGHAVTPEQFALIFSDEDPATVVDTILNVVEVTADV